MIMKGVESLPLDFDSVQFIERFSMDHSPSRSRIWVGTRRDNDPKDWW